MFRARDLMLYHGRHAQIEGLLQRLEQRSERLNFPELHHVYDLARNNMRISQRSVNCHHGHSGANSKDRSR